MNLCHLPVQVLACDTAVLDQNWGTQDHCDPFWRLYVNKRRRAYLTLGGARYDISPNRIHLIPAWVRLRCHCESITEHVYIHFSVIGLSSPMIQDILPEPIALASRADCDAMACSLFRRDRSDFHETLHTAMVAQGVVCRALDELFATLPVEKVRRLTLARLESGRIAPVFRYIENHLDQRLDNAMLARIAHMSKSRFIHEFGRVMGQTPARYVTELRIAAAAEGLAFTDNRIEDIASAAGFTDRFYFTRVFARLMGISPAKYRRVHQSTSNLPPP